MDILAKTMRFFQEDALFFYGSDPLQHPSSTPSLGGLVISFQCQKFPMRQRKSLKMSFSYVALLLLTCPAALSRL